MRDMDSMEDDAIVAKVLGGDRNAFGAIVGRYGSRVVAFCRVRTVSDEEARDAAQEVFIRAFSSLGTYRRGECFRSWLFAIAVNHTRSRFRLLSAERRKIEAAGNAGATEPLRDPVDAVDASLRSEALRAAIRMLPVGLKRPVELYYFAELSVEETARTLGIGTEAVKSRLFRARRALRARLEDTARDSGSEVRNHARIRS